MLRKCSSCGRRRRIKVVCVETGKRLCRKCCDMKDENCQYKHFCWNDISG